MRSSPSLPIVAAIILATSIAAHAAETIRPGYWESTDKVTSPIESTKVDRRCITREQVAKFMTCYINHHYTCVCPERSYDNGQIHYQGICTDAKGRKVGIVGRGTYTPTTLHLEADVTFHLIGLPITGRASTDAHRIADDCPAEAVGK